MEMCSRCHKRVAVVFITRIENNETKNEGICLKCAKELGIKPVNDMLDKMGISEEDLDSLTSDMNGMFGGIVPSEFDDEEGGAPAIDLPKIFSESGLGNFANIDPTDKKKKDKIATGSKEEKDNKQKFLSTYCHNLTEDARQGKLDNIIGRDKELARVIQILLRRQKNNPCLIGEPGVGKTAIAEALAQKIVSGDVPFKLRDSEVYLLDLTALVAGTQFRGQFESRVLGLIKEVKAAGNIILVIDEVHNIVGTGDSEGSMNAANIMKPALSRGEIQVIGATTLNEYRKYIEKDTALERRFQPVTVNEPSIDDTVKMLKGIKKYYEAYHGITIPDEVLRCAATMSERYITDRYLPDKAIDLIDEASSQVSLSNKHVNDKLRLQKEKTELEKEKEQCEALPDSSDEQQEAKYRQLAAIKVEELRLEEDLKAAEEACSNIVMTIEDLARVIEIWTGIPASSITENEFSKLDKLELRLKERIIGQDTAISSVTRAIKRKRAGVSYKRKPVSFIFAGPTGVGKTELVKTLAADLFDSPETLIRLDMSEFMEKHSVSRIIGSPPGYVGYDDAGQLTEKIRRRPYSVVLFDEIEKAHPDVLNILLQILDDGRITDAHGKTVNFENTVIVMTTNAGSESRSGIVGFAPDTARSEADRTEKALSAFLRPEFINRVDEIITFRSLDVNDFESIAHIMLSQLAEVLVEKSITLKYDDSVARAIAEGSFSEKYGARNMRRYIQKHVEDKLAEKIISDYSCSYSMAKLTVNNGEIEVECI